MELLTLVPKAITSARESSGLHATAAPRSSISVILVIVAANFFHVMFRYYAGSNARSNRQYKYTFHYSFRTIQYRYRTIVVSDIFAYLYIRYYINGTRTIRKIFFSIKKSWYFFKKVNILLFAYRTVIHTLACQLLSQILIQFGYGTVLYWL